jgi:hypothetical protein
MVSGCCLIGQAKTGISSLELSHHLGVDEDTAWLLHNKILRAMNEREDADAPRGTIQMDGACLGGERSGGESGLGAENNIPIVAAGSLNEAGRPIHSKITLVAGFSFEAVVGGPERTWHRAAGLTYCWEISRPASAARSTPSTVTRPPGGISASRASTSTGASDRQR